MINDRKEIEQLDKLFENIKEAIQMERQKRTTTKRINAALRLLVFADYPEWGKTHRWAIPTCTFDEFSNSERPLLNAVFIGAVGILSKGHQRWRLLEMLEAIEKYQSVRNGKAGE